MNICIKTKPTRRVNETLENIVNNTITCYYNGYDHTRLCFIDIKFKLDLANKKFEINHLEKKFYNKNTTFPLNEYDTISSGIFELKSTTIELEKNVYNNFTYTRVLTEKTNRYEKVLFFKLWQQERFINEFNKSYTILKEFNLVQRNGSDYFFILPNIRMVIKIEFNKSRKLTQSYIRYKEYSFGELGITV